MKYNIKNNKIIFYTNYLYLNKKHNHTSFKYKYPIVYDNSLLNKSNVLKENKNKSGIYRLVNKINDESYVGSSINLTNRFRRYYNINYLQGKILIDNSRIYRALLKYGYYNFSLEILEYCNNESLKIREQYYLDLLKPEYNICKTAGSMLGFKHSLKTLEKFKNRDTGSGHITIIINIENNSIKKYNSIRAAAKDIGVSHTNLLYHINKNRMVKGIYLIIKHKPKYK
jgi:hypothetical protein